MAKANCFLKDNLAQGKAEPGATSGTNGRAPAPGAARSTTAWNEPCRRGAAGTQLKINNLHRAARYGISNFKMTPKRTATQHVAQSPL